MQIRPIIRIITMVAMAITGAATTYSGVAAAESGPARIRMLPSDAQGQQLVGPGYYRFVARPGSITRLFASIANDGGAATSVRIVPVDAASGLYGGISYDLPQAKRSQVGSWVHLSRSRLRLRSGQSRVVAFTVRVPRRVAPGDHIGGLTAFIPTVARRHGFGSLQVQLRVVVAVLVRVPGPAERRMRITDVSAAYQPSGLFLLIHLRNTGRLLTGGYMTLRVSRVGGHGPLLHRRLPLDLTVPQTRLAYPVPWPGAVSYGRYRVRAVLRWPWGLSVWTNVLTIGRRPPQIAPSTRPVSGVPGGRPNPTGASSATMILAGTAAGIALVALAGLSASVWRRRSRRLRAVAKL